MFITSINMKYFCTCCYSSGDGATPECAVRTQDCRVETDIWPAILSYMKFVICNVLMCTRDFTPHVISFSLMSVARSCPRLLFPSTTGTIHAWQVHHNDRIPPNHSFVFVPGL